MNSLINISQFLSQTRLGGEGGGFAGIGPFLNRDKASDAGQIGTTFELIATTVLSFLTIVAGLAFLLYFVLGAISWITSGGDAQKVEAAKNQMTAAAIGLIAVISAYTIAGIVSLVLGINILNPAMYIGLLDQSGGQ